MKASERPISGRLVEPPIVSARRPRRGDGSSICPPGGTFGHARRRQRGKPRRHRNGDGTIGRAVMASRSRFRPGCVRPWHGGQLARGRSADDARRHWPGRADLNDRHRFAGEGAATRRGTA
jgi:hypothetical protein